MITVIAENGSKKEYKIYAYVEESPQVYMPYEESEIGIYHQLKGLKAPVGFTASEQKIEDKMITIYENGVFAMVYGVNAKGEKNFYLWDKEQSSIIRPNIPVSEETQSVNLQNYIIYIMGILLLASIILLIILVFKQRKGKANETSNQ